MARGRRRRPIPGVSSQTQRRFRSRVVPVHDESGEPVRRPSSSSGSHHSHSSRARVSSDSEHSPSSSRRGGRERTRRHSRSPSHNAESPAWAKDILKALEDKTKEVKAVEEQLLTCLVVAEVVRERTRTVV